MLENIKYEILKETNAQSTETVLVKTKEEAEELTKQGIQCTTYSYNNPDAYAFYSRPYTYTDAGSSLFY